MKPSEGDPKRNWELDSRLLPSKFDFKNSSSFLFIISLIEVTLEYNFSVVSFDCFNCENTFGFLTAESDYNINEKKEIEQKKVKEKEKEKKVRKGLKNIVVVNIITQ